MEITFAHKAVITLADLIQIAVVVAAVGAAIVALVIAARDRRAAMVAASKERRYQALRGELDLALRLLQNSNRGGSTDPIERAQLGAEAITLVGFLGEKRVPRLWKRRIDIDDAKLRALLADPDQEEFKKWTYESQLAVNAIVRELGEFNDPEHR
ncbi:MAG: hypothetical protein QOH55_1798 [Microbacteriaceae bacterium]|jgi:hypothetical protein|nr:hypothetical protein [Microbacteriaceae bacterium]